MHAGSGENPDLQHGSKTLHATVKLHVAKFRFRHIDLKRLNDELANQIGVELKNHEALKSWMDSIVAVRLMT